MNIYCCKDLKLNIENKGLYIGYTKRFRSFYIEDRGSKYSIYRIDFCPWCGKQLPKPLDNEYDIEIAKILGKKIEDIELKDYGSKKLPREFKSDTWWKKRGL